MGFDNVTTEGEAEASGYETFDTFDPERPVDPDTRTN